MTFDRAPLLADTSRTGRAWCAAYSELVDNWLAGLFATATDGNDDAIALVAVGGYGRSELAPGSDIDVMLVHDGRNDVDEIANRIWYPIWDAGLHLGHSVRTRKQALSLASDDLDTATALLSSRRLAGDARLAGELFDAAHGQWRKKAKRWLQELGTSVEERHANAREVAHRLEPDLKEGRGGLRDVHALHWLELAEPVILAQDADALAEAYEVLLCARVELQRQSGRNSNVLSLQEQAAVAERLRYAGGDEMMKAISEAARTIAWTSDDTWRRLRARGRGRSRRGRELLPGVTLRDDELHVDSGAARGDALLPLRAAVIAAQEEVAIERSSLEALAASPPLPERWPDEARALLVELLLTGRPAIAVIEALDQRRVWTRLLPEWLSVRAKSQHNPYHRFTVDRHLLEAAANAAAIADRVKRPDLLVVGALLHDLGKGSEGDHTQVGMRLVEQLADRLGFSAHDRAVLVSMVEHHLLLPDVATRRNLDDPSTIERVAQRVGDPERLELLAALTEADSIATGPSAWSPWKAHLLKQLVDRTQHVLAGGDAAAATAGAFPTPEQLRELAMPGRRIEGRGNVLTIVTDDRPGLFARVTGVLAMHGLDVLTAGVFSSDDGRALEQFTVDDPFRDETPWDRVVADIERALAGRLAINARVADRARTYGATSPYLRGIPRETAVSVDNNASSEATVIDVETVDRIGALYAIASALSEMDLDIVSAKVQTLGLRVVDAFYVRDRNRDKIDNAEMLGEIERAIIHNLAR